MEMLAAMTSVGIVAASILSIILMMVQLVPSKLRENLSNTSKLFLARARF
jgi:hypothetical protein